MFTSSEEAMQANEAISFGRAAAEIRSHGMKCREPDTCRDQRRPDILIWDGHSRTQDGAADWETVPRTTKAILQFLGY